MRWHSIQRDTIQHPMKFRSKLTTNPFDFLSVNIFIQLSEHILHSQLILFRWIMYRTFMKCVSQIIYFGSRQSHGVYRRMPHKTLWIELVTNYLCSCLKPTRRNANKKSSGIQIGLFCPVLFIHFQIQLILWKTSICLVYFYSFMWFYMR